MVLVRSWMLNDIDFFLEILFFEKIDNIKKGKTLNFTFSQK